MSAMPALLGYYRPFPRAWFCDPEGKWWSFESTEGFIHHRLRRINTSMFSRRPNFPLPVPTLPVPGLWGVSLAQPYGSRLRHQSNSRSDWLVHEER